MDYCEFFDTEEDAIAVCREMNRALSSKDPACCAVVDGPRGQLRRRRFRNGKGLARLRRRSPAAVPGCYRLITVP